MSEERILIISPNTDLKLQESIIFAVFILTSLNHDSDMRICHDLYQKKHLFLQPEIKICWPDYLSSTTVLRYTPLPKCCTFCDYNIAVDCRGFWIRF